MDKKPPDYKNKIRNRSKSSSGDLRPPPVATYKIPCPTPQREHPSLLQRRLMEAKQSYLPSFTHSYGSPCDSYGSYSPRRPLFYPDPGYGRGYIPSTSSRIRSSMQGSGISTRGLGFPLPLHLDPTLCRQTSPYYESYLRARLKDFQASLCRSLQPRVINDKALRRNVSAGQQTSALSESDVENIPDTDTEESLEMINAKHKDSVLEERHEALRKRIDLTKQYDPCQELNREKWGERRLHKSPKYDDLCKKYEQDNVRESIDEVEEWEDKGSNDEREHAVSGNIPSDHESINSRHTSVGDKSKTSMKQGESSNHSVREHETSTNSVEAKKTSTDSVERKETSTNSVEGKETSMHSIKGKEISTNSVEGKKTSTNSLEGKATSTHSVKGKDISTNSDKISESSSYSIKEKGHKSVSVESSRADVRNDINASLTKALASSTSRTPVSKSFVETALQNKFSVMSQSRRKIGPKDSQTKDIEKRSNIEDGPNKTNIEARETDQAKATPVDTSVDEKRGDEPQGNDGADKMENVDKTSESDLKKTDAQAAGSKDTNEDLAKDLMEDIEARLSTLLDMDTHETSKVLSKYVLNTATGSVVYHMSYPTVDQQVVEYVEEFHTARCHSLPSFPPSEVSLSNSITTTLAFPSSSGAEHRHRLPKPTTSFSSDAISLFLHNWEWSDQHLQEPHVLAGQDGSEANLLGDIESEVIREALQQSTEMFAEDLCMQTSGESVPHKKTVTFLMDV